MGLKRELILAILGIFILAACSEDPDLLYSKAETEAALGSRQKALNYLMQIQQSNPEYTEAYLFAARLFFEDNNLTDAVNQCKRGLDAQADSAQILRYIGEIYYLSGSLENAYQYYRMAVQANDKNVEAQISLGYILNDKDLYEAALSHFNKALELDSANYQATVGKAKTLRNSGKTAASIELLQEVVKSHPMEGAAYGALAMAQEQTALEDKTILENYALAVKLSPKDKSVWDAYVDFMMKEQDQKAAVKVLQNYLYHFPQIVEARHRLAELYIDLARSESLSWLDAARQQCDQALISDQNDHYSHALLAKIYLLQEKPRLALLEAQLAFEINPNTEYRELVDQAKFYTN
ncbi:MAG: tetratricopeptide repeat protein [Candidatus Marinimicrobia bacterium]|nr:tetratricopeptide repeat protein [Candidatus Neomarinimicrobiota bacterium]MCF7923205.1 tetratricopeptide repeat protein [Candidatus Neomarinimicrobiota bacterium]